MLEELLASKESNQESTKKDLRIPSRILSVASDLEDTGVTPRTSALVADTDDDEDY